MVGQKQRLQVRTTTKTSSSNKQPAHAQQQMNRNLTVNNNGSSRNSSSSSHRQHRQRQQQGCGGVCCFSSSTCNKNTTIMMLLSLCSFVLLSRHVLWEEISFSSAVLYYNSNNNDYDDCSSDDNNNDDDDDIRTTHSRSSCQKKKNNKRIVVNNNGDDNNEEQQQQQQQNRIAQQHDVEVVSNKNNNNPKSSSSVSKIMKNKNHDHHLIRPYHPQPRVMSYVWNEDDHMYEGQQQLPLLPPSPSSDNNKKRTRRRVRPMGNIQKQREIKDKDKLTLDPAETDTCKLKYNWQKTFQPNCNILHELIDTSHGMPFFSINKNNNSKNDKNNWYYKIVGEGYWRDVWLIQNFYSYKSTSKVEKSVYKTMRFEHEYTQRNVDRMRRDAAAMEHLTSSKYIIDIYAYCGTSSLSEFGDGGDIPNAIYPPSSDNNKKQSKLTQIEKLRIATQASIGLADVHNVDKEGEATIAHTDITPTQFIKVQDVYKLNDFNRARFLTYNTQSKNNHTLCPYYVGNNPGKFRSPEEYDYEGQTESVDVYSMGNIFFLLLQEEWPFDDISSKSARKQVLKGQRPSVYLDLWNSTDPVNMALKEAMIMCHVHDPKERVSARTLETFLRKKLQEIDPVGYRNLKRS